ncbi:MAG: hypothetical protein ABW213_07655 [Tardiphaga sp.]
MEPGNNDVGMETSIAPADAPASADKAKRRGQGAMSQQGFGWHGNECYPQKLVQLVGHREPRTAPEMWDRLRKAHATQTAT